MIERAVVVVFLILIVPMVYRWFTRRLLGRAATHAASDPILAKAKPGVPTIVYFTTPLCVPCRTLQEPALKQLQAEMGDVIQVIKIDASRYPDTADRWGVFSAPTTFILDSKGQPRNVNHGVADCDKLKGQLQLLRVV